MASSDRSGLRVTASDALEFEPVQPEPRKRNWGARIVAVLVVVVGAAAAWQFYGPGLLTEWGGADAAVPLIKVEAGPIKVRPENPGGLKVPDRDKLVYDRIEHNAEGRGPERLLPPPEAPLPKPGEADALAKAKAEAEAKAAQAAARKAPTEKTNPVAPVPTVKDVAQAKRPAPPPPPAPPGDAKSTSPMLAAAKPQAGKKTASPASKPAAKPTPEPAPSPSAVATQPPPPAMPKAPVETASTMPVPKAQSAPVPAGGRAYLVQLAAARSPKGAEDEWKRLQAKHRDLLDGLRLRVMKADLGQRGIFYRLRAGPLADASAAKALCQELAKREVGCLVIKPGG